MRGDRVWARMCFWSLLSLQPAKSGVLLNCIKPVRDDPVVGHLTLWPNLVPGSVSYLFFNYLRAMWAPKERCLNRVIFPSYGANSLHSMVLSDISLGCAVFRSCPGQLLIFYNHAAFLRSFCGLSQSSSVSSTRIWNGDCIGAC